MKQPYVPTISPLEIYPKNPEIQIPNNTCTLMFIAALFTIAKVCKQPKCPSVDKWIKNLWYIIEYKSKKVTICNSMDRPRGYYAK